MSSLVPGDVFVYPALLGYFFDAVLTVGIAWDGQQFAVFGSPLVLVDDVLRHVQQADVRLHSRLLAARLYPQIPVEGNLQVFFREVRHVAPAQPREARKKHQSKGDRFGEDETQCVVCQLICNALPHSPKCKLGQYNARFPLPSHYLFQYGLEADKQRS